MRETEQHRYQSNKLQTNIDWINEQIDDPNLLKGLKVGVLGLGKLGKHIAKIFKVKRSKSNHELLVITNSLFSFTFNR